MRRFIQKFMYLNLVLALLNNIAWSLGGGRPDKPNTPPKITFNLRVSNGIGSGNYEEGTSISVRAFTINDNLVFSHWSGDTQFLANEQSSTTTFAMPARDARLIANFKNKDIPPPTPPETFTLNITNGTGSGSFEEGQIVPIQAHTAPDGFAFDRWHGDVEFLRANTDQTTLVMPSKNISLQASYRGIATNPKI